MRTGRLECMRVSVLGDRVHVLTARVREAQHTGRLVHALPCRVVPRLTDDFVLRRGLYFHDVGVAAGSDEGQERRFQVRVRHIVRGDVRAEVMHRYERDARRQGQALREVHTDQQGSDESRRSRDRNGVDVRELTARVLQRLFRHLLDALRVPPRGDLRHHAAVEDVLLQRGRDDVRQDLPSVFHDRDGGLVAGTFNA